MAGSRSRAIWVDGSGYEIVSQLDRPTLPLDEGDRVVGISLVDEAWSTDLVRAFHDFLLRGGIQSVI